MTTTLYRIDGIKLSNGKQAYGSKEMSVWLPVYIRFMWEIHRIRIVVIKVADLTATVQSATTHVGGYAWDGRTWNLTVAQQRKHIYESTRLGDPGTLRVRSQGFDPHSHNMLDVDRPTNCSYQIAALKRGRDGLARNGPDPDAAHRPPQPWPGWAVGLTQMLAALGEVTLTPAAPTPTGGPFTMDQFAQIMAVLNTISGQQLPAIHNDTAGRNALDTAANEAAKAVARTGFNRDIIEKNAEAAARHTGVILDAKLAALRQAEQDIRAHGVDEQMLARIEEVAHRGALAGAKAGTTLALENIEATVTIGSKGA